MWWKCRCFSCCVVTQRPRLSVTGVEFFTSIYPFSESSAWSGWECWPPLGPLSQLFVLLLNLPCSFPPSHCPFDGVLGKARRPGRSWLRSVRELRRFLFFLLSKDEKAKGLDLTGGPQLDWDWASCGSAFKSTCSSCRRVRKWDCKGTRGRVKAVGCVRNKIGLRAEVKKKKA